MSFEHIHLGAGKDGLGTILERSIGPAHVVVWKGSRLSKTTKFVCCTCDAHGTPKERELETGSLSIAEAIDRLEPEARAALCAPELLLTTAITPDGIAAQSDFLVAIARERDDKPTVLVVCEEEIGDAHANLRERLKPFNVDVRRGVVNRLSAVERSATHNGRRAVRVDERVQWLIEGVPDAPCLHALDEIPGVDFTEHIEQHALRIRWLGAGMVLQLGLLAAERKQPHLRLHEQGLRLEEIEQERKRWLDVMAAFVPIIEARCPALTDTPDFALQQAVALIRHDDDVLAILRNLKRASLGPFFSEFERSVAEPCRLLAESCGGRIPPELERVFAALDIVLCDIARYSDHRVYADGDMHLSASADVVILERYREMLTGILPLHISEDRVHSLGQAFDEHRSWIESTDL